MSRFEGLSSQTPGCITHRGTAEIWIEAGDFWIPGLMGISDIRGAVDPSLICVAKRYQEAL